MCPSSSLFQPTLPLRGATSRRCRPSREASCFNPRSPCGERRASGAWRLTKPPVFQPTLPLRGATRLAQLLQRALPFQPTLPLRGATPAYRRPRSCRSCFNPRSPCGERLPPVAGDVLRVRVSTHAPLAGSDDHGLRVSGYVVLVSTHAPLAGSDHDIILWSTLFRVSTHAPLAGSDPTHPVGALVPRHVSTHAPLAGSDSRPFAPRSRSRVSTHAPLAGSDRRLSAVDHDFLLVSTHAPLAGSDRTSGISPSPLRCFNPRSPCGERPNPTAVAPMFAEFQPTLPLRGATAVPDQPGATSLFQPTLPLRGATGSPCLMVHALDVSTHAPLAGSDLLFGAIDDFFEFQPTLPLRGATARRRRQVPPLVVSTHAPLAGSDAPAETVALQLRVFQPTLPLRGATTIHPFDS